MLKIIPFFLSLFLLAACSPSDFDTLKVDSIDPANHQYGVLPDAAVTVVFSADVEKETLEKNFTLNGESGTLAGHFNWISANTVSFIPANTLVNGSRYTVKIAREVRDSRGNKMGADFHSEFYAGDDIVRPSVVSSIPVYSDGGTAGISETITRIEIDFSEPMDIEKSGAAFSISPDVTGYISWENGNSRLVYNINQGQIKYGMQYKFSVSGDATDVSGNKLTSRYDVVFTVGTDFAFPEIDQVYDKNVYPPFWSANTINEGVNKSAEIAVHFTKPMKIAPTESAFSITQSVTGDFTWSTDRQTLYFKPTKPFTINEIYMIRISSSAEDINGRKLNEQFDFSIRINGDISLPVYILTAGGVEGSFDNGSTDPFHAFDLAAYPVMIDMGPGSPSVSLDESKNYFFKVYFRNSSGPVEMDAGSLYENYIIESLDSVTNAPSLVNITKNPDKSVTYEIVGLKNNLNASEVAELYRFTINAGNSGVKDINGNTMANDFCFDFKDN